MHLRGFQGLDTAQKLLPLALESVDEGHAFVDADELFELAVEHGLLLGEKAELEQEPVA